MLLRETYPNTLRTLKRANHFALSAQLMRFKGSDTRERIHGARASPHRINRASNGTHRPIKMEPKIKPEIGPTIGPIKIWSKIRPTGFWACLQPGLNYIGLRPPAGRCPGRLKAPRASTLSKSAFGLLRSAFGLARPAGAIDREFEVVVYISWRLGPGPG